MTKKLLFFPVAALALSACNFAVNAEDRRLEDGKTIGTTAAATGAFTRIEALGPDNIVFVTGDAFTIKAEGDAQMVGKLRYVMDDGAIIIGREKGKWWGKDSKSVTITITAPTLEKASLAGSGDFTADRMTGDEVSVELAGSGNARVADIAGKSFESEIAGSGDVMVAGKVERAEYSVAGSGNVDAAKLLSADAKVSIAGSGDVTLNATGKVDASIAGSGNVSVAGGAKCSSSSVGSGKVSCS